MAQHKREMDLLNAALSNDVSMLHVLCSSQQKGGSSEPSVPLLAAAASGSRDAGGLPVRR